MAASLSADVIASALGTSVKRLARNVDICYSSNMEQEQHETLMNQAESAGKVYGGGVALIILGLTELVDSFYDSGVISKHGIVALVVGYLFALRGSKLSARLKIGHQSS